MTAKQMYTVIESARRALKTWNEKESSLNVRENGRYLSRDLMKPLESKETLSIENWSLYCALMNQIESYNETMKELFENHSIKSDMNICISRRKKNTFVSSVEKGSWWHDIFKPLRKWSYITI